MLSVLDIVLLLLPDVAGIVYSFRSLLLTIFPEQVAHFILVILLLREYLPEGCCVAGTTYQDFVMQPTQR